MTLTVLPLRKSRNRRALAVVGALLLVSLVFLWALVLVYLAEGTPGLVEVVLLSAPWAACSFWGARLLLHALGRSELRVEHEGLVLVDSLNAAGPIRAPREAVDVVALDDGSVGDEGGMRRFPVRRDGRPPEFLWVAGQQSSLRRVGDAGPPPNLAVLLKRPLSFDGGRRVVWSHTADSRPVKRGEPVTGLLVSVRDLNSVRLTLSGWPMSETTLRSVARPLGVGELGPAPFRARAATQPRWQRALAFLAVVATSLSIGFAGAGRFALAAIVLAAALPVIAPAFVIARRSRRAHSDAARHAARELRSLAPQMSPVQRANALADFRRDFGEHDPEYRRVEHLLDELNRGGQRPAA